MDPPPIHCHMHARTDPGRVRDNNEDAVAFDSELGLCVLADGLGGYNAGEVASNLSTRFVLEDMRQWLRGQAEPCTPEAVRLHMRDCVSRLNLELLAQARTHPAYAGMASTLVVGAFCRGVLVLGHVGDSRCYRWRDACLQQLTRDHSYVQEQVDAGRLTPQQAAISPSRNLVTRALGVSEELELEVHLHQVREGDLYLLCSDGLTDMVDVDQLQDLLRETGSLAQHGERLVAAANERGGLDNIAVLLVQLVKLS